MITLCMDTAYKYLTVGVYEDGKLLAGYSEPCFKHQSEQLFVVLLDVLESAGLTFSDVDRVLITQGPGSYTGIRIAMTVAKVLCTRMDIPLYVVDTLRLYGGKETCTVLLDARGKRAYAARYEDGKEMVPPTIIGEDQYEAFIQGPVYGDLCGGTDPDFLARFAEVADLAEPVENVHGLVPLYLKDSSAYKV